MIKTNSESRCPSVYPRSGDCRWAFWGTSVTLVPPPEARWHAPETIPTRHDRITFWKKYPQSVSLSNRRILCPGGFKARLIVNGCGRHKPDATLRRRRALHITFPEDLRIESARHCPCRHCDDRETVNARAEAEVKTFN